MQAMAGSMTTVDEGEGAASFLPTNLADLALWLKADALTLNDGDAVSTWTDSSGNSKHATQTLTARPLYKSNIQNGLPVLRYDGVNDYMVTPSLWTSNTQFTVFLVTKALGSSLNGVGRAIATFRPQTGVYNGYWHHLYRNNITNNARMLLAHDGATTVASLAPSTSYPFDAFIINSFVAGTNATWWINGTQKAQALNVQAQSNANAVAWIGSYYDLGDYYFQGDFAEMITYQSALTDTDRAKVEAYLSSKWAITLA